MSDTENVTVTENAAVTRDPVTGQQRESVAVERNVERRADSSWALWVAGIAVFGAALVIALLLLGRDRQSEEEILAAEAQAEMARMQAEQAIQDANAARMDATVNALTAGDIAANNAAAASAAAAEAAAARAASAAENAASTPPSTTVVVREQAPPSRATLPSEEPLTVPPAGE